MYDTHNHDALEKMRKSYGQAQKDKQMTQHQDYTRTKPKTIPIDTYDGTAIDLALEKEYNKKISKDKPYNPNNTTISLLTTYNNQITKYEQALSNAKEALDIQRIYVADLEIALASINAAINVIDKETKPLKDAITAV